MQDRLETSLPQVRGVPTVTLSALAGRGLDNLMDAVVDIYDIWNSRVPTAQLNRWLAEMTERHPPPATHGGRRLRLRYMTQVRTRPPTFAVFTQRADELPEFDSRYLVNGLRETFVLQGVPIRFGLRNGGIPTPRSERAFLCRDRSRLQSRSRSDAIGSSPLISNSTLEISQSSACVL